MYIPFCFFKKIRFFFFITYLKEFIMLRKLVLCHSANVGYPFSPHPSLFVEYRPSDWVVYPAYFLDEETKPKIVLGLVTFFGGGGVNV